MGRSYRDKLDCETALTFDDVLLRPSESSVEPNEADVRTRVSANLDLNIPVVSAAMDTVTEASMATAMARNGGLGVVHRNMSTESQTAEIRKVKEADRLVTRDVVTASPDDTVDDAVSLMERENVSGLPVVDDGGELVGIVSNRDLRPMRRRGEKSVDEIMTRDVVTVGDDFAAEEALELMHENRVERLPVVEGGEVRGIVTMDGILRRREYDDAVMDDEGGLAVAAAVSPFDAERAEALDEAGADALMVDTAHAHNTNVVEGAREIADSVDADVVVGNIATEEAARDVAGFADGLKVGVGPGSICTTRVVSGAGMPQITAVTSVADVAEEYDVPVIADGGIRYSGDIAKSVAAGADAVMLGSLLAGTDEAPGRTITIKGKKYKQYRGMGSVGAMTGGESSDRYFQEEPDTDYVPEGIEGAIPYRGTVEEQLHQLVGGLQSGMGYVGAPEMETMKQRARFVRITDAGRTESHPHDVMITDEAPNYRDE
ncbi:IMP dehydrogenase [Haladaptatus sp. F3-133]|uniref:Inosine-5'-monophosphate dehydrogenase n=1 Tax=Halorutilus salinus TaxID=2487751 RepID=A0A9Q4GI97_9EURY|nr:IMP dehydrogenase [Halorutilus salinus]MCX2818091.1 IMP dehydrogenase [Halorutilus salinus]